MSDIIETENGRVYTNRVPPCGHSNGTHPSLCWWMAVCDAVAAERARIVAAVEGLPYAAVGQTVYIAAVLRIIDESG